MRNINEITMEALESRTLLAGDVTATVLDGILSIDGDHQGNDVTVDIALDTITINGGGGTNINGSNQPVVITLAELLTPITRLQVNLAHGNNTFVLNGGGLDLDSGHVMAGKGNNEITINNIDFNGNFNIFTGKGNNDITTDTVTAKALQIKTGKGTDTITVIDTAIRGKFMAMSGKGADLVVLDGLTAGSGIIRGDGEAQLSIIGTTPARININGITIVNQTPVIENADDLEDPGLTVLAGSLSGTVVGQVLATDVELNTLTYALDSTVFAIDASGVITVSGTLGGAGTVYELPLTVADWQTVASASVTITVV